MRIIDVSKGCTINTQRKTVSIFGIEGFIFIRAYFFDEIAFLTEGI